MAAVARPERRRLFQQLASIGASVAGLPLIVGCGLVSPGTRPTSQPDRSARLGFLAPNGPPPNGRQTAFLDALRELGYVEGQNLVIEYRWAEEREDRLPTLAAELVTLRVDVIFASTSAAGLAAKAVTTTTPIVVPVSSDPVAIGLVASLARPGGNVTGLSLSNSALAAKRVELLHHTVPSATRLAALAYAGGTTVESDWTETEVAARALGLSAQRYDVRAADESVSLFETMRVYGADALIVLPDPFFTRQISRLVDLANQYRLPGMYEHQEFTAAGGLLSYGPDIAALYRRAANYVYKILKGANPADLPVEQPTIFDFVINLKTAQAAGFTIPRSVLAQATEVIQ